MLKHVSILGSTGSIGRSTLDVIRKNRGIFKVDALAARSNAELLREQIKEFHPELVVLSNEDAARSLRECTTGCTVLSGVEGLNEAASRPVDIAVCALVGAVGLHPLLSAIRAGNRVAIANKEPLVMAGKYVMEEAARHGVDVLPIDSEHSAIFQCLQGNMLSDVRYVHLTASGGPFYRTPPELLSDITPGQATCHPTWDMGAKISVDSATLMNKGLEIIEAMWLFGLRSDQIQVVIHPQSIIHSMVEFVDGSILAQLGVTDMRIPIALALSYPERLPAPEMRLDVTTLSGLSFSPPDCTAFPCLALARAAAETGGTAPAILNASNEVAVDRFCAGRLSFTGIAEVVARTLERCACSMEYKLDAVLNADRVARECALSVVETMKEP
ncbi:MAG: 1-deoxy-D-xylulose-5-phosphate reductoisomerase [Candidatus Hydrogenedentes bacterium]|nr:1-deoxy-D-xylulose-5-phosphate reductoisomerase [Candidatus Hydrogenedentota bacterium]